MEETLIDLQTRLAYQEETLEQLNRIVTRQQDEIDRLRRQLELLGERLREIRPSPVGAAGDEPPPPHY